MQKVGVENRTDRDCSPTYRGPSPRSIAWGSTVSHHITKLECAYVLPGMRLCWYQRINTPLHHTRPQIGPSDKTDTYTDESLDTAPNNQENKQKKNATAYLAALAVQPCIKARCLAHIRMTSLVKCPVRTTSC